MPWLPYSPHKKTMNRRGQLVDRWKLLNKKCVVCGTKFTTRNPNRKYCSTKCLAKAYNKRRIRDANSTTHKT